MWVRISGISRYGTATKEDSHVGDDSCLTILKLLLLLDEIVLLGVRRDLLN